MNPDPRYPLIFTCEVCHDIKPVSDLGGHCKCGLSYAGIRGMGMIDVAGPVMVHIISPLAEKHIRRLADGKSSNVP